MQLPLLTPDSDWTPPAMDALPSWADAKRVAVDVETRDEHLKDLGIGVRRGAYITGVSFAIEDGPRHYLPYRHEGGDNLDEAQVLAYLAEQGQRFSGEIVGANLSYDLDHLWEDGVTFPQVQFYRDIQIADPLIYELHNSYSLQEIAKRHGLPGKDQALLEEAAKVYGVSAKSGMWRLPARFVGAYAEADVDQPLKVLRRQERRLEENDLWSIWDLESQVLPVLVKLRRRGVLIDQDKLHKIEEWTIDEEGKALGIVKRDTGVSLELGDVWSADTLAPAFEAIGVRLDKTSTGKPSIGQELFDRVDHPVAKAIAHARKVNKLRTTFAASIRRYMTNGRIHTTFNQIARETESGDQKGARYGRLSSTHPNLQQQPSRDEFAAMWRSIYIPEPGAEWGCLDYSQQEPRWTTHFAAVMGLPGAKTAAQAYWDNPDLDNHQFMADLTGLPRKHAKCIYLGLCYGEGGAKLCRELGLPTRWALRVARGKVLYFETRDEALDARKENSGGFLWEAAGKEGQEILDTFDQRAPFIRKLSKKAEEIVKGRGFIKTLAGRRLHFPQRQDGSYDWTHKALNRLIQGMSADQMKTAMVTIDREMPEVFMQLQVHDELDGSFESRDKMREVADIMSQCIKDTKVPFLVDVEAGPSWGEIEEIAA